MALCTRCGRQTEGAAEFCWGCGSYPGSREPDQPQAAAAMTGNAGYLRPFAWQGTDGTELAPGTASTPAGGGPGWSLQPASPSGQSPDSGVSGPGDAESPANSMSMPRGPFEPVRRANPQEQYPPAGSGGYEPAPAYAPDSDQPAGREPDPLAGGYSLRAGPAPAGGLPAAPYQPAPPAGQAHAGQPPVSQTPDTQSRTGLAGAAQVAPDGYPGPDRSGGQLAAGGYAPPGQSPAVGYNPPGQTTAQFPAAGDAPAGQPQPAAILTDPGQVSVEAPPAEQPVPGQSPAGQPAGAFAPSGPAWLGHGRPAGTAPAAAPPEPTPPRSATAARRAGLRRRAPESGDSPFPSQDAAPERSWRRPRGPAHNGRWIPIAAAAIVLVVCAVSAVILLSQGKPATRSRAGAGSTVRPRQPSPAPGPTPGRLVTIEPAAAAGPNAPAVAAFLTRYFTAINNHDFAAYKQLFSTSLRDGLSRTAFLRGYGSSKDSGARLQGITAAGTGEFVAAVTFTSHQQPAASPDHTACNVWTISLYLVREGSRYVIVAPPASYQATVSTCS